MNELTWGNRSMNEPDWRRLVENRIRSLLSSFVGEPNTPSVRKEMAQVIATYIGQMYPIRIEIEVNEDTGEIIATWDDMHLWDNVPLEQAVFTAP